MITIKGTLERFTYQNPQNNYTIARLRIPRISDPVTIVGYMAGVSQGETVEISGSWTTHPKYGDQFKIELYKILLPATVPGIKAYLGSGLIKGINQFIAEKIVDHFQENTFDIIENEPEKLKRVRGIGEARKQQIVQAWNGYHGVRKVMQFLQENDAGTGFAGAILQQYGSESLHVLQNDPYQLVRDIPQIGFKTLDAIAMKSGTRAEDGKRLEACVIYSLLMLERDGHVYGPKEKVLQICESISGVKKEEFDDVIVRLADSDDIRIEEMDAGRSDKDSSNEKTSSPGADIRIYLTRLYRAEAVIASRIKAVMSMPVFDAGIEKSEIVEKILSRLAVKLSREQLRVVIGTLKEKIVVITGGPGTGKTTLIRALCEIFNMQNKRVVLTAPTGRAARRLFEVTGKKAFTLHKLLGFDHKSSLFERNSASPLDLDILIIDEASMVDTMLMCSALEAMPATANLMLVGDTFQLPSIGAGNVLADIIESNRVKVFSLKKIFRQARQSPIIIHAHDIRNGKMPELKPDRTSGQSQDNGAESPEKEKDLLSEFYFIENHSPAKVAETIIDLCSNRIPEAFPHIDEIQVLTPMHRGEAGTINLNNRLQKVLNPSKRVLNSGNFKFKAGDKVMHLKNNYDKDVFNGDIGFVIEIIESENKIMVDYDGRIVEYDILELDELTLAYAVSVHKSQGSEYSAVIFALTMAHFPLLQRNLLYTAMTRGKQLVIIVGSTRAFEAAFNNNKTDFRFSGLRQKLES